MLRKSDAAKLRVTVRRAGQHRGVRHSQLCMTTIKEMNMKE